MVQFSVQSTLLSEGYAAFNADDWDAVKELFCEDTPSKDPEFPAWYPMDGGDPVRGWQAILQLLQGLRADGAEAQLLGVADQGNSSLTLDVTFGSHEQGPHACADKVEFDEAGRIKVFWHCAAATHKHGHAGHPAGHSHP